MKQGLNSDVILIQTEQQKQFKLEMRGVFRQWAQQLGRKETRCEDCRSVCWSLCVCASVGVNTGKRRQKWGEKEEMVQHYCKGICVLHLISSRLQVFPIVQRRGCKAENCLPCLAGYLAE